MDSDRICLRLSQAISGSGVLYTMSQFTTESSALTVVCL